jgi:hypothetical protein
MDREVDLAIIANPSSLDPAGIELPWRSPSFEMKKQPRTPEAWRTSSRISLMGMHDLP